MTENDVPQQLSLLRPADVPIRFRLDADTRRRGRQHVAEIRQILARRQKTWATIESARALPSERSTAA